MREVYILFKKTSLSLLVFSVMVLSIMTIVFNGCSPTQQVTQQVVITYSSIHVPEEGGVNFEKITDETADKPLKPKIGRYETTGRLYWWVNPYFDISKGGDRLAYLSMRNNNTANIYVKSLTDRSGAQQRTFSSSDVESVTFSQNGEQLCFTRKNNTQHQIYVTSSTQGTIVQQISGSGVSDYAPRYLGNDVIFFSRSEGNSYSIWSYNMNKGSLMYYSTGMTPYPINDEEYLCSRTNSTNNIEIWKVNFVKGTESIILSLDNRSCTTASLSPDGKWIVFVANTPTSGTVKENLDVYVIRADGTQLTQLTYHQGHDLSPVWSPDGKYIYFLSQRGTETGDYNIWKMNFNL